MKLIIDINDNDYELINKTGVTLDFDTVFHGKEKDKELTFAVFYLVKALKNGTPYEERPHGEWIPVSERLPDTDGYYLVSFEDEQILVAHSSSIIEHHDFEPKMLAWQPLPEPYKKGGAECE